MDINWNKIKSEAKSLAFLLFILLGLDFVFFYPVSSFFEARYGMMLAIIFTILLFALIVIVFVLLYFYWLNKTMHKISK